MHNRNAFRSGLFMLITLALMIGVVILIRGVTSIAEPLEMRSASFTLTDDIGGLGIGDDVRVGGFKVGEVRGITVVNGDGSAAGQPHLRVQFTFPRRYVVHADAAMRVQTPFTGASCLNFESLGTTTPLAANDEIAGHPSALSELTANLNKLQPSIREIIDTVKQKTLPTVDDAIVRFGHTADTFTRTGESATQLADDVRGQVDPALRKYHSVADRASEMLVQIRDMFGDSKTDFHGTMANLNQATGAINKKLPGMLDRMDVILTKVDTGMSSANTALEDIKESATNARQITAGARDLIVGNKGKFDGMIVSLKTASDNLKSATAEIRRSPWRLLYKPAPNEMANLNLYDAAREFAEGAGGLSDASQALRDALHKPDVNKAELDKLMNELEKSFGKFKDVEQTLWKNVKE